MHKRQFLKNLMLTSIGAPLGIAGFAKSFEQKAHLSPLALASDDAFWDEIRKQYLLKPDYINLENGYYNFLPQQLLHKYIDHIKEETITLIWAMYKDWTTTMPQGIPAFEWVLKMYIPT